MAKLRRIGSLNSTKVGVFEEDEQMVALGLIDHYMADWLERSIKKYPSIKTLYIDSPGGDGLPALHMAELINKNNFKIVVDGRCFSACAQVLFVAAKSKEILPWSMLGVHDAVINIDGVMVYADTLLPYNGEQPPKRLITKIKSELSLIRQFNRQYGFKTDYLDLLRDLQRDRRIYLKQNYQHGPTTPNFSNDACLKITLWLVNPTQLKEMGITNIKTAWFPANETELQSYLSRYESKRADYFVGNSQQLRAICSRS